MDSPSSTSSSSGGSGLRRWPWALLLAAAVVVAADALLLGASGPWPSIQARLREASFLERGVVADRVALRALAEPAEDDARPLAFVVGSSRIYEGFQPQRLQKRGPLPLHFVKLAHVQMTPFEIRSAVPEMLDHAPALVVIGLSEFDTHDAVELLPETSFVSFAAIGDVVAGGSLRGTFRRRHELYRAALARVLGLYHYRRVLGDIGLDRWHTFGPIAAVPEEERSFFSGYRNEDLGRSATSRDAGRVEEQFDSRFPERPQDAHREQVDTASRIGRGEDASIQQRLVERSVSQLRRAGVEVLVVELPLYPGLQRVYDASTRVDFLDFMAGLEETQGIRFVSLDAQPRYLEGDFDDPIHLGTLGSIKLTRVIVVSSIRTLDGEALPPARSP